MKRPFFRHNPGMKDYSHNKDELFESDDQYFLESKDAPANKILYYMYLDQGAPDILVIDLEAYRGARLKLFHSSVIKQWQYTLNTFTQFLVYLKKWHLIARPPDVADYRYIIKLRSKEITPIQDIQKRIDPERRFKKDKLDEGGREVLDMMKKR